MATQQEVAQIFTNIADNFDPNKLDGVNATIQFDLSGENGGLYWVRMADGTAESGEGAVASPDMTLKAAADDWANMVNGDLNPMQAFMTGKIKIQGDMALAMKLQALIG